MAKTMGRSGNGMFTPAAPAAPKAPGIGRGHDERSLFTPPPANDHSPMAEKVRGYQQKYAAARGEPPKTAGSGLARTANGVFTGKTTPVRESMGRTSNGKFTGGGSGGWDESLHPRDNQGRFDSK